MAVEADVVLQVSGGAVHRELEAAPDQCEEEHGEPSAAPAPSRSSVTAITVRRTPAIAA